MRVASSSSVTHSDRTSKTPTTPAPANPQTAPSTDKYHSRVREGMKRDEATYLRQQERHAKGAIRRYFSQIGEDTTDCVREHPWWTVATCLLVGLVGGMIIGREALSKTSPADKAAKE